MHITRRSFLLAVLFALLVTACGDNSGLAPMTTIPPESTTTVPATTTTDPGPMPQIETGPIPAIPAASLTEDYGGPLPIETVCIELEINNGIGDHEATAADLAAAFELIGVDVVGVDCDLSLGINMYGRRYSAEYESAGECFTGWEAGSDIVASVAGEEWDWSNAVAAPTSEFLVGDCTGDEAPPGGPVPTNGWVPDILDVFGDLFGSMGRVAARLNLPPLPPNGDEVERLQTDDVTYDVLTAALYGDSPEGICRAAGLVGQLAEDVRLGSEWVPPSDDEVVDNDDDEALPDDDDEAADDDDVSNDGLLPAGPELLALIPHLIDRLAAAEAQGWECTSDIDLALRIITDEDPGRGARGWAEWWLQTPEGQASVSESTDDA